MFLPKGILLSAGMALASVCHAADNIDQLYQRISQKDEKAFTELQALANGNDPQAQALMGFIYEQGITVPADIPKAIHWYEQACNQGGEYGCYNARYFYHYGKGVPQDAALAQQFANKAKTDDLNISADLMNKLIDKAYTLKSQADADKSQRPKLIRFVSHYVGHAPDSDLIFWGRIGFSKSDILHLATRWAQDGDPQMSYVVGKLYLDDFSTLDDKFTQEPKKKAMQWFQMAAEKGYPAAQYVLGETYESGAAGLKIDNTEAKKWYQLAADQKNKSALVALGDMYYTGHAGQVDYDKAVALFEQADSSDAKLRLSWMYYNGLGKTPDCSKAWDYYAEGAGKYNIYFTKDKYTALCEQDYQERKREGNTLPHLTLKHYGSFYGGRNEAPQQCRLTFKISADRISNMAKLHLILELKNSKGASQQYKVNVPPFSINTLGVDMNNNRSHDRYDYIDIPMYNRDFCDFNDLIYMVKLAKAELNGKEHDLLKEGNFQSEGK
ncbi:sel1 repeat family protein [Salmonella enterica subsp. enterica]|nr:sel1 repeat family protein [Salmonella enterica subsp. enterica]EDW6542678.1 sel1 repeat family protein [Salmonella enterica subsp. enterica]EEC0294263.1 sel1 repeat family protein [Salmonella enterica subsp. enterica]EGZ4334493.1 sel1 repeat family protein [Salmonella enterica subsp. enterica serovar Texas]